LEVILQGIIFNLKATFVCGQNRKVKDKAVGVDLHPPFHILLKYTVLQGSQKGPKESKEKGRTSEKPDRPVLSAFLNEVRTFFESNF
jgi:hypothetical protein